MGKTDQNLILITKPQRELCLILKRKQHQRFSLPLIAETKTKTEIQTEQKQTTTNTKWNPTNQNKTGNNK